MKKCSEYYKKLRAMIENKTVILYFLFLIMMILAMTAKRNLHVDEVLTYGLSNYNTGERLTEGKTYAPAKNAVIEYTAVQEDARFHYGSVWKNQMGDTHPPIYYALVHTICSLFPGRFSIWYAGIINIVFALLTLYVVRCLVHELTRDDNAVILTSIVFIFSAGILSSVPFLRMYIMAMFEVTFITLLFVRAVKEHTWNFYAKVIMASVLGALTHYYFIVYLFFLCFLFGIYLLIDKKYKETGIFIITMIISGGLSIAVFPGMIKHMFFKDSLRGGESIENLQRLSITEYGNRLKGFYSYINGSLAGNILTYVMIAGFIFVLWRWISEKQGGVCGKSPWIIQLPHQRASLCMNI